MDPVIKCYERIKIIMGVGNGIITHEQIKTIAMTHRLNSLQQKKLYELLDCNEIHPISEEERLRIIEVQNPKKEVINNNTNTFRPTDQPKHFEEDLLLYIQETVQSEKLLEAYVKEVRILIDAIKKHNTDLEHNEYKDIITDAMRDVCYYRIQNFPKRVRFCGTYMAHREDAFCRWVGRFFSEDDLKELIRCCSEEQTFSSYQLKILIILLHKGGRI